MRSVLGFVAGALVAGGVVWFVVKKDKPPEPAPVIQTTQVTPAPVEPAPARPAPRWRPSRAVAPSQTPEPPSAAPYPAVQTAPQAQTAPAPVAPAAGPAQAPPFAPAPEPPPPPPEPHVATLSAGTLLPVRLGETLSSEKNKEGDTFTATLDRALVIDGFVVAERGARVEGRVVEADRAGRVRGVAHLAIEMVRLTTADGQHIALRTEPFHKDGAKEVRRDAAKIGAGAAIGAAIGAIAGGGRGAAVGAGAGGAAGTGTVMATRGKAAELPVETRISFRVNQAVTITEKLR